MIRALASVDVLLAAMVLLLTSFIVVIRFVALRRMRSVTRLRPAVEMALADHLAGSGAEPSPVTPQERAVLLTVALEVLTDLQGAEHARLVGLLEKRGYVTEAGAALGARSRVRRQQAAETLSALATPAAVQALEAALADTDALVRTAAARTLAEVGGDHVIPAVAEIAQRDINDQPGAAAAVVLALGTSRPGALAPLLAREAPAEVRDVAVTIVGELRLPQYGPALQDCLAGDDLLAASAARGLGRIGDATAVAALGRLALDRERPAFARAAAVTALGAVGDPAACPVLERLVGEPDWPLLAATADALAHLAEPGRGALARAAASPGTDMAALARAALAP